MRKLSVSLLSIEKILKSHPFVIPRSFQNRYYQTLASLFLPYLKNKHWKITKKSITIPDGTQLKADCILQENFTEHPTVLVLDGFLGSCTSRFSLGVGNKAFHFGFNVILLNQRGQGNTMYLTKSICDSGLEGDLGYALKSIIQWGFKNLYIVGYSHGGFLALREMGIQGKAAQKTVNGIVVISPPIDAEAYSQNTKTRSFFSWLFVKGANRLIKQRAKYDPPGTWDLSKLKSIKTIRQWDETILHTLGNFTILEEYFAEANALPLIPNISIPTLLIHSHDDPLFPTKQFERQEIKNNPYIITLLTKHGAHGAFISLRKNGDLDRHWAQNRAIEFFRLLEKNYAD